MSTKIRKEPTGVQLKDFWEHWGFRYKPLKCDCTICRPNCWVEPGAPKYPSGSFVHCHEPTLDLNTLFRWAVPKTIVAIMDKFNLSELKALGYLFVLWQGYYNKTSEFTYSLFWAIEEVRTKEVFRGEDG